MSDSKHPANVLTILTYLKRSAFRRQPADDVAGAITLVYPR
ncbi:hypothetical protein ACFQMB_17090 [Pseudobowmanella zhangzhouensis]